MAEHPLFLAQVPVPPAPQAIIVDVAPGQVVDLPAPAPETALAIDGNDVLIAQPEAPPILLRNFVELAQADPPPIVQLADAAIPAPDLVGRLAPVDAMRVDTLLQSLPAPEAPPGRLAPLPDFLVPEVSLAEPHGDAFALRDEPHMVAPPAQIAQAPSPATESEPLLAPSQQDTLLPQLLAAASDDETILGTPGDDVVTLSSPITGLVDLGEGTDTLNLSALTNVNLGDSATEYRGIEKIDLRGGDGSQVTLSAADVLDLSPTTDTLLVRGDATDQVVIGSGWTAVGTQTNPAGELGTFAVYTQNVGGATATLLVENSISVA